MIRTNLYKVSHPDKKEVCYVAADNQKLAADIACCDMGLQTTLGIESPRCTVMFIDYVLMNDLLITTNNDKDNDYEKNED